MYVRPPNNVKSGMKIPENYSGNAFSRGAGIADMPPPARMQTPRQDIPHSDISPEELREKAHAYTSEEISEPSSYEKQKEIAEPDATVGASIFSSLLPRGNISSHFPFGHGIGSEEILILAVMLMVFLSGGEKGEVDSEFLLLLGLLLFAG